jgi:hypothetical protein
VIDIATHLFTRGVQFDEDNADWLMVPGYVLPRNWHHIARRCDLLLAFPNEYPRLPPVGFYLMANLPSANGHLYDQAYHEAWQEPIRRGWRWYCCYIAPGAWRPAPVRRPGDWRAGDNLWTYITLVNEALASND